MFSNTVTCKIGFVSFRLKNSEHRPHQPFLALTPFVLQYVPVHSTSCLIKPPILKFCSQFGSFSAQSGLAFQEAISDFTLILQVRHAQNLALASIPQSQLLEKPTSDPAHDQKLAFNPWTCDLKLLAMHQTLTPPAQGPTSQQVELCFCSVIRFWPSLPVLRPTLGYSPCASKNQHLILLG
jgi:hypothetical protein